jgi:hypothetical protein
MKIKLPWHTYSQIVEMYGNLTELEKPPSCLLEVLQRINEREITEETTSRRES